MENFSNKWPDKHKLVRLHLSATESVLCRAFEGGSGVYSLETEDFDDNRYWCQGEMTPGCSIEDIENCDWEYVNN